MNHTTPTLPPFYRQIALCVPLERGDLIWTPSNVWRTAEPGDYGALASRYGYVARPCGVVAQAVGA